MEIGIRPDDCGVSFRRYYNCTECTEGTEGDSEDSSFYGMGSGPGCKLLRRYSALYRVFADLKPTRESIDSFCSQFADPEAEPEGLFVLRPGDEVWIFSYRPARRSKYKKAIVEVKRMRRCVRLWDMVTLNEQQRLGDHFKLVRGDETCLEYEYDSHPDWPRVLPVSWPHDRGDRVTARLYVRALDLNAQVSRDDRRLAARVYLTSVINEMLENRLVAQVVEVPESQGRMEVRLVPKSLLGALWLQFAEHFMNNRAVSRCLICGEWFLLSGHKDKVYCADRCNVRATRMRAKARQLREEGKTLRQAAKELNTTFEVLKQLLSPSKED
jgi:hypothetical protein